MVPNSALFESCLELLAEMVPVIPGMLSHPGELSACSHDVICDLCLELAGANICKPVKCGRRLLLCYCEL